MRQAVDPMEMEGLCGVCRQWAGFEVDQCCFPGELGYHEDPSTKTECAGIHTEPTERRERDHRPSDGDPD